MFPFSDWQVSSYSTQSESFFQNSSVNLFSTTRLSRGFRYTINGLRKLPQAILPLFKVYDIRRILSEIHIVSYFSKIRSVLWFQTESISRFSLSKFETCSALLQVIIQSRIPAACYDLLRRTQKTAPATNRNAAPPHVPIMTELQPDFSPSS